MARKTALHRVAPVKGDDIKVTGHEVEAGGLRLLHGDAPGPDVFDDGGTSDDVVGGHQSIEELHF